MSRPNSGTLVCLSAGWFARHSATGPFALASPCVGVICGGQVPELREALMRRSDWAKIAQKQMMILQKDVQSIKYKIKKQVQK